MSPVDRCARRLSALAALSLAFGIAGCKPIDCPGEPTNPNAVSARCSGTLEDQGYELHTLVFRPQPGASWRQCVDMRVLEGFWPGMTIGEARTAIGPENATGTSSTGRYWLYERPAATIRISLEDIGSTFLPVDRQWRIRAIPRDHRIEAVFRQELASQIPPGISNYEAVILTQCGVPAISVDVRNGRVSRIDWIRNRGSMPLPSAGKGDKG